MTNFTIQKIFNRVFNGQKNMMTPYHIEYIVKQHGTRVIEISQGEGITHNPIFGVTVLDYVDGKWGKSREVARLFNEHNTYIENLADAEKYVDTL